MKIVRKSQSVKFDHGRTCTAIEYPLEDKDINVAIIELRGRYPQTGFALNEISKETAYVVSGSGLVVVEGKESPVSEGDVIMIMPGEKFYWEGKMALVMPCTPAWNPEQYKSIE